MVKTALAGVDQLVGASSHNQKVAGLIPHQGTYLGCGFNSLSLVRVCTRPIQGILGGNRLMLLSGIYVSLSVY